MTEPTNTVYPIGRTFILGGYGCGFSPAMQSLHEHACGWLQTVDGLGCFGKGSLSIPDAKLAADIGYRGDDIRKARAVIAKAVELE